VLGRLLLLLCCLVPARARASPLELFGPGGIAPGQAATGVADCDTAECLYLDPAGLAEVHRKRFTLGLQGARFDLAGTDRNIDDAVSYQASGALPLAFGGWLEDRVGLAVAAVVPTHEIARVRSPRTGDPFEALLESRAHVVGIEMGFGLRLSPAWAVGLAVHVLASLEGNLDVTTDAAGRFTTASEQSLTLDMAPIVGVRFSPQERWRFGAVYRGVSQSRYGINLTSDIGDVVPVQLPELRFAGAAQYDPMALAVEAAWRPRAGLSFRAQVEWERWSAYRLPAENPVVGGPALPAPGFHDTFIGRLAASQATALGAGLIFVARAGYAYVPSPAPDDGRSGLLDNRRQILAVGLGLAAPTRGFPFHLDLFFQLHHLGPRTQDRGADSRQTSGNILVGGLTLGVDL
jgi:hypothetical protein